MQLIMFDIDGTLTQSNALDDEAFLQTLVEVFNCTEIETNWSHFAHVTDSYIFPEVGRYCLGRSLCKNELQSFRDRFLAILSTNIDRAGGLKPIPGTSEILAHLTKSQNYAIAYAGGAWTDSALLKLKSANLPSRDIPYAFADDAYSREEICAIAFQRAQNYYQQSFSQVTYIGDGVWDVRTARNLGYAFIGISWESDRDKLIAEGATHVLPNFQDIEQFLSFVSS
jgi:phosphoglycolate phosphatase-like HAD superfamily hydrolase